MALFYHLKKVLPVIYMSWVKILHIISFAHGVPRVLVSTGAMAPVGFEILIVVTRGYKCHI